jgi:hypothetical protein
VNAGFSNYDYLKKQILAGTMASTTRFDAMLQALGLGVANQIEKYCNRKFGWVVGWQQVFGADSASFVLERFPVVPPIALVEYKQDEPTGWVVQPQISPPNEQLNLGAPLLIRSLDAANGIIYFDDDDDCGDYWSQMRFTYTGGYFWEQAEPDDATYPTPVPAGAPLLPDGLLLAWLLQVKHVWKNLDKIGTDVLSEGRLRSLRFPEDFAPTVGETLSTFRRYQLT